MKTNNSTIALALIFAGVLPFVATAALSVLNAGDVRGFQADQVAVAYGAVIISFLGGIRWGDAISKGPAATMVLSVFPSMAGFFSLLINNHNATMILIAAFAAQAGWDILFPGTLPNWFIRQRMIISATVILCLLVVLLN